MNAAEGLKIVNNDKPKANSKRRIAKGNKQNIKYMRKSKKDKSDITITIGKKSFTVGELISSIGVEDNDYRILSEIINRASQWVLAEDMISMVEKHYDISLVDSEEHDIAWKALAEIESDDELLINRFKLDYAKMSLVDEMKLDALCRLYKEKSLSEIESLLSI